MAKAKPEVLEEAGTDVVNWEEKLAGDAKVIAAQERPPVSKISFKSGVMTYMGITMPNNELDCIAIAYSYENVLYTKAYDPDVIHPPGCFAISLPQNAGSIGENMVPHEVVPEKQNGDCQSCPQMEWGSGKGRGRACSVRRRIAVIPADALKDLDNIAKAEIAVISLPVMSVQNWAKYVNLVSAQYSRPYWAVITKVKLKPDPKTQFKVYFDTIGQLPQDALGPIHGAIEAGERVVLEPYNMETGKFGDKEETADSDKF